QKPYYIIPGNHDTNWSESGTNSFRQIFGQEKFVFDTHEMLFVGTGSGPNMRMAPGLVPHEDIVWLRKVLSKVKEGKPVIFFNHYPIDSSLANWYLVIDKLKKVNTQAILHGHGHRNKAANYEGIPATMGRSNLRAGEEVGGYNIVKVTSDKMIFSERNPGVRRQEPWRIISLEDHEFATDTTSYKRPSYKVNEKYSEVSIVWQKQAPSDIGAGIVVQKGLAIYPNTAGFIVARHLDDGELAWKFKTGGKVYSTPAAEDSQVIVASTDSTIYNLNIEDGSLNWKYKTGKSIVASPVVGNHTVYIGSSEGVFRALSLADGSLKWKNTDIKGFVVARPLLDDQNVYFGTWGNRFYALNKQTGKTVWQWTSGSTNRMYSPASVYPVKADGKIFITAPDRYITALDAKTGKVIWRSNKHKGRESIGISEDKKLIYTKAMNGSLFAYDANANKMELEWAKDIGLGYEIGPSPIVEKGGIIYVPADDGRIFAVAREKQQLLWIHKISNALVNAVYPLGNNEVLATTMDGKVVRLKFDH
ncbi:MAG TPA: PQQ-binding-like beta-propeller repeat protein, partial [Fodinibius sp.]|nr:PQQ-binding-like beta-propeller repeat protein [Fodinibius sp.]